jgi:hypothetical protein
VQCHPDILALEDHTLVTLLTVRPVSPLDIDPGQLTLVRPPWLPDPDDPTLTSLVVAMSPWHVSTQWPSWYGMPSSLAGVNP